MRLVVFNTVPEGSLELVVRGERGEDKLSESVPSMSVLVVPEGIEESDDDDDDDSDFSYFHVGLQLD
jgi:hypothetical protein